MNGYSNQSLNILVIMQVLQDLLEENYTIIQRLLLLKKNSLNRYLVNLQIAISHNSSCIPEPLTAVNFFLNWF